MKDLFKPDERNAYNDGHRVVTTPRRLVMAYPYTDEQGEVIYQKLRYEPKDFRVRQATMSGYVWNLDGVRRVLYRLDDLARNPGVTVFVVEGEKDVETLVSIGLLATCSVESCGGWEDGTYARQLTGRHVVVIPDNDAAGIQQASRIVGSLIQAASVQSLLWLELPGLPERSDVTDWVDQQGQFIGPGVRSKQIRDQLLALVRQRPDWRHK